MEKKDNSMPRREFLKTAPLAAGLMVQSVRAAVPDSPLVAMTAVLGTESGDALLKLRSFDYENVALRDSRWKSQVQEAREYYFNVSNDDILHGFRSAAGLPAPGKPLGGWCRTDSQTVFGQWLSGMARLYRATGDTELRDKAFYLLAEWAKTVKPDGDCRMRHYTWDKMVCGLVDLKRYADNPDAVPLLQKTTRWAIGNLERSPKIVDIHHNTHYYGLPQEWYTLSENLYRAYELTGDPMYRDFAEVWLYPQYWNKFLDSSSPADAQGVHAYSHVNTFSGAAMAYAVKREPRYLKIIKNFYDYMQRHQCFATGGYGPNERFMLINGGLGKSLETRSDTFETLCGSWAAFKLSRYLMTFTGEARYGDWIERLFYNGTGAALPLRPGGRNFYYSDYRTSGGLKVDYWDNYTCCSGTYFQNMAAYHDLIYFHDDSSLYVNLYVPSEVAWQAPAGEVKVVQETSYPETETSTLTLSMERPAKFAVKLRVPAWSKNMTLKVNGADTGVRCVPGQWANVSRVWNPGDKLEVRLPLRFRYAPVDTQHPRRVAVMRGPVVFALEYNYHAPFFELPEGEEDLNTWLVADDSPARYRVERPDHRPIRLKFRPFYDYAEDFPYLMYFDLGTQPYPLW